jgi:hypothetical protein
MSAIRHKCVVCGKLTYKWQKINGGPWHCYDGCKSTTGIEKPPKETDDRPPLWLAMLDSSSEGPPLPTGKVNLKRSKRIRRALA